MGNALATPTRSILRTVDLYAVDGFGRSHPAHRSSLGQFATGPQLARYMAALFADPPPATVNLLDAGAGVGALSAAYVEEFCQRTIKPRRIEVTAYEIDEKIAKYLRQTLDLCAASAQAAGIEFRATIKIDDFIAAGVANIDSAMFDSGPRYNAVIMNPPYRKVNSGSDHRRLLSAVGVETSNLYTAFLSLATLLLEPQGELVAITPRSFCNGPYFKPFRQLFLREMSLRQIHVFNSREDAFSHDDEVIYVGDAGDKFILFDREGLAGLGVEVDEHGKMPDVMVLHKAKGWLVLIEAVTSHGPVNPKRHRELKELFAESRAGLVFVTAFLDRKALNKYIADIAWETEVWVAESPTHLIHFNGERFLGPYGVKEFGSPAGR